MTPGVSGRKTGQIEHIWKQTLYNMKCCLEDQYDPESQELYTEVAH